LIYEELLEENEDRAKHYYKHYDGPKLQPHLYDNELVHLKTVNRSAFYPFLPNDHRKFPEIPPKVPESMFVYFITYFCFIRYILVAVFGLVQDFLLLIIIMPQKMSWFISQKSCKSLLVDL